MKSGQTTTCKCSYDHDAKVIFALTSMCTDEYIQSSFTSGHISSSQTSFDWHFFTRVGGQTLRSINHVSTLENIDH